MRLISSRCRHLASPGVHGEVTTPVLLRSVSTPCRVLHLYRCSHLRFIYFRFSQVLQIHSGAEELELQSVREEEARQSVDFQSSAERLEQTFNIFTGINNQWFIRCDIYSYYKSHVQWLQLKWVSNGSWYFLAGDLRTKKITSFFRLPPTEEEEILLCCRESLVKLMPRNLCYNTNSLIV